MAKTKGEKKSNFWWKVLGVLFVLGAIQAYPWILVLALLAGAAILGIRIAKKVKANKAKAELPEAEPAPAPVITSAPAVVPAVASVDVPAAPETKMTPYFVKGVFAHEDEIFHNLMAYNPEYDYTKKELIEYTVPGFKVYKWIPKNLPAELVPEPDNKYDPNAIRIVIGGITIGYIPKEECSDVLSVINEGRLISIDYQITGGAYRMLDEDYDLEKDKTVYSVESGRDELDAMVYVKERLN